MRSYHPLRPFLRLLGAAILALATCMARPAGAATPIPVGMFFNNAAFSHPQLSPDGSHVAMLAVGANQRQRLGVVDLRDFSVKVVAEFRETDVHDFKWISDERLLFNTQDSHLAQGDQRYGPGLFAVNRDGSNFRQLARSQALTYSVNGEANNLLPPSIRMLEYGAQDSSTVYVADLQFRAMDQPADVELLQLNTLNGKSTGFTSPTPMRGWLLDYNGQPRLAFSANGDLMHVHLRDQASGAWREIASFNSFTGASKQFKPLAFGPDGVLYVTAQDGNDVSSLYRFDPATGKLGDKPLLSLQGYDFRGRLIFGSGKLLGVRFVADGEDTVWFDDNMKAIQQTIDKKLPHTVNLIMPATRPSAPWMLVTAYSDRQPQVYMVYNAKTGSLQRIAESHAGIKPSQMGRQEVVRYKARDGLEIPALLTLPAGQDKNLPLVMLVHGGPWMRGSQWGWEAQAQFLASRGYAVLAPDFRGSTGYGGRHFQAGWRQWGMAMQDDIADGAKWAIAQGYADPARVCIAGASYGGYSTLMGLVKDPGLYRCGIAWAGVTDISLLYSGHWRYASDFSAEYKLYGMPHMVGDPVKDAERLNANSPLQQAARITRPLLLAHGGADVRVPLVHGLKMRDALKPVNKNLEWVEYEKEGHGWFLPDTRIDFWTRVEAFLDHHIGPASQGQP